MARCWYAWDYSLTCRKLVEGYLFFFQMLLLNALVLLLLTELLKDINLLRLILNDVTVMTHTLLILKWLVLSIGVGT